MSLAVTATIESWPIAGAFSISRGTKTEAIVVVAEISDGVYTGRGECVPYPRYDETPSGVKAAIDTIAPEIAAGRITRTELQSAMPAGAARNALDCAIWDFEAKRQGKRAWTLAGLPAPRPVTTAYTISLASVADMVKATEAAADYPLLKIKLGGEGDRERIAAIRDTVPRADLIVDANEAWPEDQLEDLLKACAEADVLLVEQPLPAGQDRILDRIDRPVPVCADESAHDRASLPVLSGRYDAINIKLDKTGGLTEALALAEKAIERNFTIMVGCMLGTSLAMAPALLVAQYASIVDLDGPLLLKDDRITPLEFNGSTLLPPAAALWG